MKTLVIISILSGPLRWIIFIVLAVLALIFLSPFLRTQVSKRKRVLRKKGWDVDNPVFLSPDGLLVLQSLKEYPKDQATPILWVTMDLDIIPTKLCLYTWVWLNDPPAYRRVKKDFMGLIDEQWHLKIPLTYTYIGPFRDERSRVKGKKISDGGVDVGFRHFIDTEGKETSQT